MSPEGVPELQRMVGREIPLMTRVNHQFNPALDPPWDLVTLVNYQVTGHILLKLRKTRIY
jgi:hypothetical protein